MSSAIEERTAEARAAFEALAPLFRYPDDTYAQSLDAARRFVRAIDESAADDLEQFAREIAAIDLNTRQATCTSTFDLAPSCSPYLGVHLFGDDSAPRARLMIGLRMSYRRSGCDDGAELPDHAAEVLQFASSYDEDEWRDLGRLVLLPAFATMEEILRPSTNPYRHLVATMRHLCIAAFPEGGGK